MQVFADLMWYFRQEKRRYLLGIFVLVIVALLSLVPPYLVGRIVDEIRRHALTRSLLTRDLAILMGTGLIAYGFRYVWRAMLYGSALDLSQLLRNRLFEHFTLMSPAFYHERRIGDLMAHATNDIQAVEATAGDGILTLVDSITTGGLVIATMVTSISWKLTLLVLIPMPFMAWATSYYGTLLHHRFSLAQESFSQLNDMVQERISGVRVVKAFGQEETAKRDFEALSQSTVDRNMAVARIDALFDPTIVFIVGISFFLAVTFGSVFVAHQRLTIGQLTAFTMYLGQLIWPMLAFGWLINILQRGRASYDRIQSLLAIAPEVADLPDAMDTPPSGSIRYDIDEFSYPGSEVPSLRRVNVHIRLGSTLGVVGRTGAGKTTFLRLILREFDGPRGGIRIGETPIEDFSLRSLRTAIAYVPQEHFLFSTTIAENIAFGQPEATMQEIQRASEMASVHGDIQSLRDGYETVVGERGVTLSGGQKQRISIARALLRNAPVLVLDDALSAVDAKTEATILDSLKEVRTDRTTIIAAHRMSAVEHADEIIVLEDGRITERGTHAELMDFGGWYAAMYRRQQLEASVEEVEQG